MTRRRRCRDVNLKHIPSDRIKAILDDPYTRGVDGVDYEEVRGELERILWEREDRLNAEAFERMNDER